MIGLSPSVTHLCRAFKRLTPSSKPTDGGFRAFTQVGRSHTPVAFEHSSGSGLQSPPDIITDSETGSPVLPPIVSSGL